MFLLALPIANAADSLNKSLAGNIAPEFDLLWSTIKLVAALGFTVLLLVFVIWVMKKIFEAKNIGSFSKKLINIIEIQYLAPKKAIALVKIADRVFIIGVSEDTMTNLGELSSEETVGMDSLKNAENIPFKNIFEKIIAPKKNTLS